MNINNCNLYLETHGPADGQPLIFLHHGLGSTRAWRRQIPDFTAAGYRVLVYDRRGYGQSAQRNGLEVPGFETDLADLGALISAFEIEAPMLVGHSDGGTIALYYAAQNPGRVAALVTIAAHIYIEPKMIPAVLVLQNTFEGDARFQAGLRRIHGEKVQAVFYNWFNAWKKVNPAGWDMRPQLAQIDCPTLVIQGEADEHATPQHAVDIAASIPQAELWLAPAGRHMLPQEMPGEFNQKVLAFLSKV